MSADCLLLLINNSCENNTCNSTFCELHGVYMYNILLVEDDVELSHLLKEYLEPDGFVIEAIDNGRDAVSLARDNAYDLIVLDVMLPELNGFEVLRQVREFSQTPVIMLTARGEEVDRIVGLEMGADDYLAKPCNPRELLARIKAILRRADKQSTEMSDDSQALQIDDVELFPSSREVYCRGAAIELTSAEYNILYVLMKNIGQVVKKEMLTEQALSRNMTEFDRSIDVHISKLRMKLGPRPDGGQRIKTVRGIGYLYIKPGGA